MMRTSIVKSFYANNITSASTLIVGDCGAIKTRTKVLALQRQVAVFFEDEGDFSDFPFFSKEIQKPVVNEKLVMITENVSPLIKVGNIRVIAVAAASGVVIGSVIAVDSEARLKHFRNFITQI
jgi:spore germination protein PE